MKKSRIKKSPKACPRCGSVAVSESPEGGWQCDRKECGFKRETFPTLHALGRTGHDAMLPRGSEKGMADGCFQIRPGGDKYS